MLVGQLSKDKQTDSKKEMFASEIIAAETHWFYLRQADLEAAVSGVWLQPLVVKTLRMKE